LYEDLGSSRGLLTVWTPYRIDVEVLAGSLDRATALARENFDALSALGELGYASTRAVELAELLLLQGDDREAERATAVAERDGLPSDVLVQFLRRSLRARLLARSGDLTVALELAHDAVALASLTDVLRYRARAHMALAEVLTRAGEDAAARTEEAVAGDLLRQKGVKGALVGAPST
jgi:ATP/maltotriose-dependent transcriptional regulator MalT